MAEKKSELETRLNAILKDMMFLRAELMSPSEILVEFSIGPNSKELEAKVRLYVNSKTELDLSIVDLRPEDTEGQ